MDLLGRKFDLLILDGAYPECALSLAYRLGAPYMYINTVGFYTGTMAMAGNPGPYSVTPVFYRSLTDDMNFFERIVNSICHLTIQPVYTVSNSSSDQHINYILIGALAKNGGGGIRSAQIALIPKKMLWISKGISCKLYGIWKEFYGAILLICTKTFLKFSILTDFFKIWA